jgi:hypothetical protein
MVLQSNIQSFTARRYLFDPDQVESKGFCGIPLSGIGGNEGNG